jgi:signal transduction histidine kinase
MFVDIAASGYRRWFEWALFVLTVAVIAIAWAVLGQPPGGYFAACFALSMVAAKFLARSAAQRYMCGAAALCAIVAGQVFCPLDYRSVQHVVFNAPFLSAYLYPVIWPGAVIGPVFGCLFAAAAMTAGIPLGDFAGPVVGVILLPLALHSLSYAAHRLIRERRELRRLNAELEKEIAARKETEENLCAAARELSRKNDDLTAALNTLAQAQTQMVHQEKMASIGQLVAGVAHEINNPLSYVTANFEILGKYFAAFGKVLTEYRNLHTKLSATDGLKTALAAEREHNLDRILADLPSLLYDTSAGLERIGKIVKGMRLFAHAENSRVFRQYDLHEGLESTLLVAHNEIKHYADIERCYGSVPPIEAIGGEINQVLLNLLVNAAQAIKAKKSAARGLIRITTWSDAEAVYCAIEDDGVGIAGENLPNIFNPFFTTKPVGQGTGMGLSISYDIIANRHHGVIGVESAAGEGATFTFRLPIRHEPENGGNGTADQGKPD